MHHVIGISPREQKYLWPLRPEPRLRFSTRSFHSDGYFRLLVHFFEPFAQLDAREGSGHQGAGLGLAIVRRISRAHGGDVHVEASSLGGAAFVLRIPRRPAATVIQGSASATATVR